MFDRFRYPALASIALSCALAAPVAAQSPIKLTSVVEIEKTTVDGNGASTISYDIPKVVVPGDRLRFTLRMTNNGTKPVSDVVINNPLPAEVAFDSTPDMADFTVSTDGGKTFGALAALTMTGADGTARPATTNDVTHVRWVVAKPVPPKGAHSIVFFGRVR